MALPSQPVEFVRNLPFISALVESNCSRLRHALMRECACIHVLISRFAAHLSLAPRLHGWSCFVRRNVLAAEVVFVELRTANDDRWYAVAVCRLTLSFLALITPLIGGSVIRHSGLADLWHNCSRSVTGDLRSETTYYVCFHIPLNGKKNE